MYPVNFNRTKEMDNVMTAFAAGTLGFMKTEGVLTQKSIEEAWQQTWAEYLASKTKS